MKIVKYILLLLLLAAFGLTVYIATQPSEFQVQKSKIIKTEKSVIFNYVNDYRNWEDFGIWKDEDPAMKFIYPDNTIGVGGAYSWSSTSSDGKTETIFVSENDSIAQKVLFSGNEALGYLTFKDTVGGTKVTWGSKGKLGFMGKAYALFQGGTHKMIGDVYEKTLEKLDKVVSFEINTYDIKVEGLVQKAGGFYLQQKVVCRIADVAKNVNAIVPVMISFFKENNIALTGNPFVLYDTFDVANNKASFSVCLPMREEIYTSEQSEYTSGRLEMFLAAKTTLKGDYSHLKEAWDKTFEYIKTNNLIQNGKGSYLEMYVISPSKAKNPSQWITEIYIPVEVPSPAKEPVRVAVPVTKPVVSEATVIE